MPFGILVVDTPFIEVARNNVGFGEIGEIGGFHLKVQKYVLNVMRKV